MSIAFKQRLMPQHRSWGEVADMLVSIIGERPVTLVCKRCRGEHVCFDPSLTIHCVCGAVTRYKSFALFLLWSSIPWMLESVANHGNCCGDTNLLRKHSLHFASIVNEPLTNPQQPIDTRVSAWRFRRSV